MKEMEIIGGFSDLKRLLILTFKIERDPALVKLHFTIEDNRLYMHDYDKHENRIALSLNVSDKLVSQTQLTERSKAVVTGALVETDPAKSLNLGFQLYGTFSLTFL